MAKTRTFGIDIREMISRGECMDVELSEASGAEHHYGIPLAVSDTFVMILAVNEWHADGAKILPLSKISTIVAEPEQTRILAWNKVQSTNSYFWVDLSDYQGLFQSLKRKDAFITVQNDDSELEVAKVFAVGPSFVKLASVDPDGVWMEENIDYPYADICVICLDSEYGTVLGDYCLANA